MATGRHRRPPTWSLGWLACALGLAATGLAVVAGAGGSADPASYATEQQHAAPAVVPDAPAAPTAAVRARTIPDGPERSVADAGRRPGASAESGLSVGLPAGAELAPVHINPAVLVGAPEPVRVRVPRLDIEAGLDPLSLGAQRELVPPRYGRAGWYQRGPEPGEAGRAVIAGHVDSKTGPDVFYNLRHARRGDRIVVDLADGSRVVFTVQRVTAYPKERFPTSRVYGGPRELSELRLITCGGAYVRSQGGYQENVVVYAVRS